MLYRIQSISPCHFRSPSVCIFFLTLSRTLSHFKSKTYREVLSCAPFASTAKYIVLFVGSFFYLFISRIGKSIFLFLAFSSLVYKSCRHVGWCDGVEQKIFKTAAQSIRKTIFGLHTYNKRCCLYRCCRRRRRHRCRRYRARYALC